MTAVQEIVVILRPEVDWMLSDEVREYVQLMFPGAQVTMLPSGDAQFVKRESA